MSELLCRKLRGTITGQNGPVAWLEEYGAEPGAKVYLDLPELGAAGQAEVLSVDACPEIAAPPSPDCRVVTGRFMHESANVIDLNVDVLPAPVGCTANHPFWSVDRQTFVQAGDLRQGETLLTADARLAHILSITRRKTPAPVYNLEVDAEHVYYVSEAGVLVHNAYHRHHSDPKFMGGKVKQVKCPHFLVQGL